MTSKDAVIYTRLSKVKTKDKESGNADINVREQEAKLRSLAELRDLTVEEPVYTDNDFTAYKGSSRYKGRKGFEAMLKRLRAGGISVILVYQIFRLYRSHSDLEDLIEVCKEHGIAIHTVSGGDMDLTTATGQMIAEFMASVGKQEVALMTERARDGKARNRAAGRWPGGRVPYGYRVSGDFSKGTGVVAIDEDKAEVIRQACADVIAGKSLFRIAADLDASGIPKPGKPFPATITRTGKTGWDPANIRVMVTNPRYAALVSYQGEVTGEGDWPAIITRDIRDRVLAALDSRPGFMKGKPGRKPVWLLSGIAVCGKCGSQNMRATKLSNGRPGYSCRDCFSVTRDAERTDALVADTMRKMLARKAATFSAAARPSTSVTDLNDRREAINRELEEWAATRTTPRAYRLATEPLYDELDRIEAKLTEAYRGTGLEGITDVPDLAAKWDAPEPDGFTMEQRRTLVRILLEVTILPLRQAADDGSLRYVEGTWPPKGGQIGDSWFAAESVRIEPRQSA